MQLRDLERTRRWIADEERREAEHQRGIEARPAPPDWLLERGLNGHSPPVYVHAGDCWNAGKRSKGITQDEARRALADGINRARSAARTPRWASSTRNCPPRRTRPLASGPRCQPDRGGGPFVLFRADGSVQGSSPASGVITELSPCGSRFCGVRAGSAGVDVSGG
ncbi:DUF6233 domain-containing protein [Streptomyces solaniscabiei]|uniref:DUF6233 domain-containing protein n=1 Tax=Streptomyces solaniscabiei TaxID=2683255 RepID=UPI0027E02233|nr:DUF6233 domain-containing protein [Streptomyces solaniscabiei]